MPDPIPTDEAATPTEKICRCCGEEKPLAQFAKGSGGRPTRLCKRCDAARVKRARDANLERARALERRKYWANLDRERARNRERRASPKGRESNRKAVAAYRQRYPEREAARIAAAKAAKWGVLVSPATCEAIGCTVTGPLHKHHPRYDRPLEVVWFCHLHHEAVHHVGPLRLKPGAVRKIARAPRKTAPVSIA